MIISPDTISPIKTLCVSSSIISVVFKIIYPIESLTTGRLSLISYLIPSNLFLFSPEVKPKTDIKFGSDFSDKIEIAKYPLFFITEFV